MRSLSGVRVTLGEGAKESREPQTDLTLFSRSERAVGCDGAICIVHEKLEDTWRKREWWKTSGASKWQSRLPHLAHSFEAVTGDQTQQA